MLFQLAFSVGFSFRWFHSAKGNSNYASPVYKNDRLKWPIVNTSSSVAVVRNFLLSAEYRKKEGNDGDKSREK